MANPQVENGHLKVANEVWEHMMTSGMTAAEFPIVFAVIRATWGWKKKEAPISLAEFHEVTRQPERTITYSLHSLLQKNILKRVPGGGRGNPSKWSFNKDWESWKTMQPIAEIKVGEINSAKINSVFHCRQTVQPIAQITATHCTVSSCKPKETKEQLSPKAIFKESKSHFGAKAPRAKDEAYEIFRLEFEEHRGIPYRHTKGDFVQLSALRKAMSFNGQPENWRDAVHNYFGTPQGKYTLADLCCRFDVFLKGKLDRFGKPEQAGGKQGRFDLHEENTAAAERFIARGKDNDEQ